MPVYNNEKFLRRAIESVLNQTFGDFEFLIIHDRSTDGSAAIIKSYKDPRIRVVSNEVNLGIAKSCNLGLGMAAGEYIAMMQGDDVSLPARLERQVAFLDNYPEIGLLASAYYYLDEDNNRFVLYRRPRHDLQLRWQILLSDPIAVPTVMLRRKVLMDHKISCDESLEGIEDYDLWTRLIKHTKFAGLRKPLAIKRGHKESSTSTWAGRIQRAKHGEIAFRTIRDVLPELDIDSDQTRKLCTMLLGERYCDYDFKNEWLTLSELYLKMLAGYAGRHKKEAMVKWLKCWESVKVLRFILCSRNRPGWFRAFSRMLALEPAVILFLPVSLSIILIRHLKFKLASSA